MTGQPPKKQKTLTPHAIPFTIVNGNIRQDCLLKISHASAAYATTYLKTHRAKIDLIAREKWADGLIDDDGIVCVELEISDLP